MIHDSVPLPDDFLVTVRCKTYENAMDAMDAMDAMEAMEAIELWASLEATVGDLKEFMARRWGQCVDDMLSLVDGSYTLVDDLRLASLLPEHRHFLMDIPWWPHTVPPQYLQGEILDLRYLASERVRCVRSWLYQSREVTEIWLLGTHPQLMEIVYAVAEDVQSLLMIRRIVIWKGEEGPSMLQRRGLVYLYQHLLLDQYRDADDVEIWLDPGLLAGLDEGGRFRA